MPTGDIPSRCLERRGGGEAHLQFSSSGGGRAGHEAVHDGEQLLHPLIRAHLLPALQHPASQSAPSATIIQYTPDDAPGWNSRVLERRPSAKK